MDKNVVLKSIVTNGNMAKFSHAIAGTLYYSVETVSGKYMFPVDMNDKEDVGTATFNAEEKAMTLMRYVRKAIDKDFLIKML